MLKFGSRGTQVMQLQSSLNRVMNARLATDGSYGNLTRQAVVKYQQQFGHMITGQVSDELFKEIIERKVEQPLYRILTRFNSRVHVIEAPFDKYEVKLDLGVRGRLERPSTILRNIFSKNKKVKAIINCGFFMFNASREHLGLLIADGLYFHLPSENFMDFEYYKDGTAKIKNLQGYDQSYLSNLQKTTNFAIGTSYSLIIDGVINLQNTNKFNHSGQRNPRTLLGVKADKTIVLVVVDGRSIGSLGVTAQQSAQIMQELGCVNAVNLDGGGSSSMSMVEGTSVRVKNRPSDKGVERAVGSCLVIYER